MVPCAVLSSRADTPQAAIDALFAAPPAEKVVAEVTTPTMYSVPGDGPHVAVMDRHQANILNSLSRAGCRLTVVPAGTAAADILALQPDGIFLSNGPGDPKEVLADVER